MLTETRIADAVKSALCEAVTWSDQEAVFALKVYTTEPAKPLLDYLFRAKPPAATYMAPKQKQPIAFQWFLKKAQFRKLFLAANAKGGARVVR